MQYGIGGSAKEADWRAAEGATKDADSSAAEGTLLKIAVGTSILLASVLARRSKRNDIPKLLYCNHRIREIVPSLRVLNGGYKPPLLHPTGLLQSRLADSTSPAIRDLAMQFVRERIDIPVLRSASTACCPDEVPAGVVSIDWLEQANPQAPTCLIVPGLTGSSGSAYVRRAASELHAAGLRVGCLNPRGRGGNLLRTPFLYSAGYTEDLRYVVDHVVATYPGAPVSAAGFSLGASYLAKYCGEEGVRCKLTCAACFACPTDLTAAIARLSASASSRFVDRFFLVRSVQKVLRECVTVLSTVPGIDLAGAASATSMEAFDGATIAPMMGCSSARQYYDEASAEHVLACARVPMLFVSALNDMIAYASPATPSNTHAATVLELHAELLGSFPLVLPALHIGGSHPCL